MGNSASLALDLRFKLLFDGGDHLLFGGMKKEFWFWLLGRENLT